MLHRTKAEQVVNIYNDFLQQYPDIYSLSHADPSAISKFTEHLGLHWRSSHFINSARYILERHSGQYPQDRISLLKIPGVGDYVAGAILTVCFGKREHVIDSNIARVINRYSGLGLEGEIRRKKVIIDIAKVLFDTEKPGAFLFALLDFTALVCKPRTPECCRCLLQAKCKYFQQ